MPPTPGIGSSIGQPITRRDGYLKVTGARYAADNHPAGLLHAVMAVSSNRQGTRRRLDVAAAKAHPGVVEVMAPENRPKLAQDPDARPNPFAFRIDVLQNDRVRYANQPVAVVIAETLEAATEGAGCWRPATRWNRRVWGSTPARASCRPTVGCRQPVGGP